MECSLIRWSQSQCRTVDHSLKNDQNSENTLLFKPPVYLQTEQQTEYNFTFSFP